MVTLLKRGNVTAHMTLNWVVCDIYFWQCFVNGYLQPGVTYSNGIQFVGGILNVHGRSVMVLICDDSLFIGLIIRIYSRRGISGLASMTLGIL